LLNNPIAFVSLSSWRNLARSRGGAVVFTTGGALAGSGAAFAVDDGFTGAGGRGCAAGFVDVFGGGFGVAAVAFGGTTAGGSTAGATGVTGSAAGGGAVLAAAGAGGAGDSGSRGGDDGGSAAGDGAACATGCSGTGDSRLTCP